VGNGCVVGVKTAAVSVNSETTVLAAEVRMAFTSGVGSIGTAGAQAESTSARRRIANVFFLVPCFLFPNRDNLDPH